MSDAAEPLDPRFTAAVAAIDAWSGNPDNTTKLRLYGLFKQATIGDVAGKRPGFTDPVGRAKFDAWAALTGTEGAQAQQAYVSLVADLLAGG